MRPSLSLLTLQVQTLNEQDWERAQQASVLANVAQAFESDMDVSDGEDDQDALLGSTLLSPSGQADAQTLALLLQEQLDAINQEIRCCSPGLPDPSPPRQFLGPPRHTTDSLWPLSASFRPGPSCQVSCAASDSTDAVDCLVLRR